MQKQIQNVYIKLIKFYRISTCVTNNDGYVPFVVMTTRPFHHSPQIFSVVRVAWSLVFYVKFCVSLFVLLSCFFWPLYVCPASHYGFLSTLWYPQSFLGNLTLVTIFNKYAYPIELETKIEWLLLSANSVIFQLYHGENKLIFNDMMMRFALYYFYNAISLKQQSAGRNVAPLGHIILFPIQPVFALSP